MRKKRKPTYYRGQWTKSKLSAKCISRLMGVEVTKTKRYLYGLRDNGVDITEEVIGQLIQYVRNKELEKMFKRILRNDKV